MTELEKLRRGQLWIMEALSQVAEKHDCMVDDFRFIPTNRGDLLFFNLNGNKFRWALPLSEIKDCAEDGALKGQIPSDRARIKQRFRELLMIHKGGVDLKQVKEDLSLNLTFVDKKLTKPEILTSRYSGSAAVNPIFIQRSSHWQSAVLFCLILLLATAVCVAFYAFHGVSEANRELEHAMGRVEKKIQQLDAGVSFDSKRQQILLTVRDEIMRANPNVSLGEAYHYAELVIIATDKYPSVDPLMFLSIGIVESGYDSGATSHANARGLYQIWPSTGRLLARTLDWEYNEDMLYDPGKNTEMAALYLDILFSAYNDIDLVLAEYNGGPLNAGYFRAGSNQAAAETLEYVHKVKDTYTRLLNKFERGIDVQLHPMHREKRRRGKALGVRATAQNLREKVEGLDR